MSNKERESILIATKVLAVYKEDTNKFSFLRNYLHSKIKSLLKNRL